MRRRGIDRHKSQFWYAVAVIALLVLLPLFLHIRFTSKHKADKAVVPYVTSRQLTKVEQCLAIWGAEHKDSKDDFNNDARKCPENVPPHLYDAFTMNRRIGVEHWYKCQTGDQYHKEHKYENSLIEELVDRISKRLVNFYGETDSFLYRALDAYPIKGKDVVIMGSQRPIYESVCIVFEGASCTTIDFQPIIVNHPRLKTMTIAEYDENPMQFDAAISISSFEHDGLGRYGDPIRPDGDITMMAKMKCILKEDGIMYLSVPIAKDKIVWNMHRVYGRIRLPKLIEHWTLLDVFANWEMTQRWSGCDANKEGDYQPVFVLKNREPEPGHNERVLNQFLDPDADTKYADRSCFNRFF